MEEDKEIELDNLTIRLIKYKEIPEEVIQYFLEILNKIRSERRIYDDVIFFGPSRNRDTYSAYLRVSPRKYDPIGLPRPSEPKYLGNDYYYQLVIKREKRYPVTEIEILIYRK